MLAIAMNQRVSGEETLSAGQVVQCKISLVNVKFNNSTTHYQLS